MLEILYQENVKNIDLPEQNQRKMAMKKYCDSDNIKSIDGRDEQTRYRTGYLNLYKFSKKVLLRKLALHGKIKS